MQADDISIRLAHAEDADAIHRLLCDLERALGASGSGRRSSSDILRHGF